jgi:hypothetical protein
MDIPFGKCGISRRKYRTSAFSFPLFFSQFADTLLTQFSTEFQQLPNLIGDSAI